MVRQAENAEMAKHQIDILISLFLFGQVTVLSINIVGANDQISPDIFDLRNFDASNAIKRILSGNWTENHECLIELNAIKSGLNNHEEWAIRGELDSNIVSIFANKS